MANRHFISSVLTEDISYNHAYLQNADPESFVYHSHDRYELILLIKGDMKYFCEGRSYDLSVGDLILTRPAVFHSIMPNKTTQYERYDIIINERLISKAVRDRIPRDRDIFKCAGNERIFDLFSKLDFYYERFSEEDFAHLVFNNIEEVIYNLTLLDGEGERGSVNPLIDKATSYIKDNLTTIKSVDEISSALYITKSHLHHIFTEYLHMTPAKYVMSKRMLLAEKKLRRGAKPTEVYSECGFGDYATFFRNYKKYFGTPPSMVSDTTMTREII